LYGELPGLTLAPAYAARQRIVYAYAMRTNGDAITAIHHQVGRAPRMPLGRMKDAVAGPDAYARFMLKRLSWIPALTSERNKQRLPGKPIW
jgi:hypothetical protein